MENVIIIGSGPAGLTAAIYTARANLKPLVFEGFQYGGQLMNTTDIENFPGFPEGIMGPDLMNDMREQAKRFEANLVQKDVEAIDLSQRPFKVTVDGAVHEAKTLIFATGANARMLGLEAEKRLLGRGVSTCATCDGQVTVSEVEGNQTSVLELKVAKEDLGKVIGKQGRTARAMRTILSAASAKVKKRTVLEIIE